jgi:outer membrane protein OmpA-like peptidoglycan-associated protein
VFDDTTALGFLPDSTELRDPQAAARTLAGLAQWLNADRNRHVAITGTCASAGSKAGRARLSRARARAIKSLLVHVEVHSNQVSTQGLGYVADPPDRRADGTLDPARAAQNRAVSFTTSQ